MARLTRFARGQIVRRELEKPDVSPERPLYFWHIPKTAGVSVHYFLGQRFPASMVCSEVLWDGLIAMPQTPALSFAVYRGHFLGYLDAFLAKQTIKFTLLREPQSRTISHYLHIQRAATHPLHRVVSSQTLLEFVTSPLTRHMSDNYQARYLASGGDLSVASCQFSPEDLGSFKFQTYLESLPLASSNTLYERARLTLDSFVFVGTSDRFDEAMQHLADMFQLPPHVPFERQNVAAAHTGIAQLDAATARAIATATEIDRELYELASSWHPPHRRTHTHPRMWRTIAANLRRR